MTSSLFIWFSSSAEYCFMEQHLPLWAGSIIPQSPRLRHSHFRCRLAAFVKLPVDCLWGRGKDFHSPILR